MRSCGGCSRAVKKYGEPVLHGVFLDQIVVCSACDWFGVVTEIVDPEQYQPKPKQLMLLSGMEENLYAKKTKKNGKG